MAETVYSPEYCRTVLDMVRSDPDHFRRAVRQNAGKLTVSVDEVERSLRAWGLGAKRDFSRKARSAIH